jgi:hypothetical protein
MISKEVSGSLAPSQMARFLIVFKITDIGIRSDLTFEQAKQLIENHQNNNDANMKTNSTIAITSNISTMKASSSMSTPASKIKNQ